MGIVHSLQPNGIEFQSAWCVLFLPFFSIGLSSFIIDVPRPLSTDIKIILFLMGNEYNESVYLKDLQRFM